MKILICFGVLLSAISAFARTDLKETMGAVCEVLGSVKGVECVRLQRRMETADVAMDRNGAVICSLIWEWGSHSPDLHVVADLVLSCFHHIANVRVSDEVRATCSGSIYVVQGSSDSIAIVRSKVKKMMVCVDELSRPVAASRVK